MKIHSGTHKFFSGGVIPYLGVRLPFFTLGAEKVEKTLSFLSGQWMYPSSSSLDEYKYPHLGVCLPCSHHATHDGWCSSCCLSKNKNENKSKKEILNKSNSNFQMRCLRSMKRTGHCAWPRHSFS